MSFDEDRRHGGAAHESQGLEKANVLAQEFWRVIGRRRWIVLACVFSIVVISMSRAALTPSYYTATTTLVIQQHTPDFLTFQDVVDSSSRLFYQEFLETELSIINSRSVLVAAAEKLDLENRPEYFDRKPPVFSRALSWARGVLASDEAAPESTDEAGEQYAGEVAFLRARLDVSWRLSSQFVELRFVDTDAELAREAVNAIADAYINFTITSRSDITAAASSFLTREVQQVRGELEEKEKELLEMSSDKEILAVGDGADITEQTLTELNRRHGEARARQAIAQAHLDAINETEADALPEVRKSTLVADLRRKYADIEREHSQMAERFKPDWPPLAQLRHELEQTENRLRLEIENISEQVRGAAYADYLEAQREVDYLHDELDTAKAEVRGVNAEAYLYRNLVAEIESKRKILDELVTRESETQASERLDGIKATNVRLIDPATTPKRPSGPRRVSWFIWSVVLGLAVGVGAAFFVDHLDNSVKTESDIERSAELPVIGGVPLFPKVGVVTDGSSADTILADLASHSTPHSGFAEAFKTLRTSVLLAYPKRPPRHLVVTSSVPEEGKSLVATNLAVALAQLGKRVLLIDADLRCARLHKVFNVSNAAGLSSILSGNARLTDVVHETGITNLAMIPSGPIPPNPSELLGSHALEDLLTAIADEEPVDHVIFDSPPVLSLADPIILSAALEATIVIVRAGKTSRESLRQATGQLRKGHGRLVGVVLNGVTPEHRGYYYRRYYGPPAVDESVAVADPKTARRFSRWPVRLVVRPPRLTRNKTKKRRDRA
jgi:capsular exopolysaccharide synthesis family protein